MDKITSDRRSWNMSRIGSKNTKPELLVRRALTELGVRYRLHVKSLPGKPDAVLRKYRTVIFINGCFWHQHKGCKKSVIPKSNTEYWIPKLKRNVDKQKKDIKTLNKFGLGAIILWECEVDNKKSLMTLLKNCTIYKQI